MIRRITSFTHHVTGDGDRITYTYSDINEDGTIVASNQRETFLILDKDLQGHVDAIRAFIQEKADNK